MSSEVIEIGGHFSLPLYQLEWSFGPSSGPGGQHANKSHTRAVVVLNLETCAGPSEAQRRRLVEKLGPRLQITVEDTRSQARNRTIAVERLEQRLCAALARQAPRKKTRPSRGSVQRRLTAKRHRSDKKRSRQQPDEDS
ncbi:MAG: alternative ribosome rescue aminoacyl-tRNA hydrolase ArfB [Acidimicrobiales bacterium]